MSDVFIIHTDGGARENPGPSAYAFIIERPGASDVENCGFLGRTTNNIAEYTALVRALQKAGELGGKHLRVFSDSELMVQQMKGKYKVRSEGLLPLYEEARALTRDFERVEFTHIRRELNKRADLLCNKALDAAELAAGKSDGAAVSVSAKARTHKPKKARNADDTRVRTQAIECLQTAASAWASGHGPNAEAIWEQLWSILEEERVV